MDWIDLSLTVTDSLVTWNNELPYGRRITSSISSGDVCNESRLHIGSHTGTHIDAPFHFNDSGIKVDELDINVLCGRCFIAEIYGERVITGKLLEKAVPDGCERLLLKTDNTAKGYPQKFRTDFSGLDVSAVEFIKEHDIRLFGNDYLSIACYDRTMAVHQAFFSDNRRIALEGLVMDKVSEGWYEMCCLPLKLSGSDGSPARVIVRKCL